VVGNPIFQTGRQVIIYGANGWMGRSAVEYLSGIAPQEVLTDKVLLIGSMQSQLVVNDSRFDIVDPSTGFAQIQEGAIFFNAAFLRREFLQRMTDKEYVKRNNEISDFAKRALEEKQIGSFVNLSSGVARNLDPGNKLVSIDLYSNLKKRFEDEYSQYCSRVGTALINCRLYSISGKHINEFENLALSKFIEQARYRQKIHILSPSTRRTYVDSIDLAKVLLTRATAIKSETFDSGGTLVTMLDLAKSIIRVLEGGNAEILLGDESSQDYFGDYQTFNSLASGMGITLSGLETQIKNTNRAFTENKSLNKS
jgi:nucleoside-diphosphate-sugar epimerase